MKISDYISKSIQTYPSLYKDIDYTKSELKVLNHIFFVIGNGLEPAITKSPNEGGYLIRRNNKITYRHRQLYDKPYGVETFLPIPEDFFQRNIYEEINGRIVLCQSIEPFNPYTIGDYCILSKVFHGKLFLQKDWLYKLIYLAEYTLDYYKDPKQYINNVYYRNKLYWDKLQKEQIDILEQFLVKYYPN